MTNTYVDYIHNLQYEIYYGNIKAGWWTDISTGELRKTGDIELALSKTALVHSEVSEMTEGIRKGLMDDHLPHRPMGEVEAADAIIRLLDLAGYMGWDVGGAIVEKLEYNKSRADHKLENRMKDGGKKA